MEAVWFSKWCDLERWRKWQQRLWWKENNVEGVWDEKQKAFEIPELKVECRMSTKERNYENFDSSCLKDQNLHEFHIKFLARLAKSLYEAFDVSEWGKEVFTETFIFT